MNWTAIKKFCRNSWTVVLARATTVLGSLAALAGLVWGDPNVNAAIQQVVTPKLWPYFVIGFGVLIELARVLPHRKDGTLR